MNAPASPIREAHAHILQCGLATRMADASTCASADEFLDLLAGACATTPHSHPRKRTILAQGARPEGWSEPGWPSLAALDRATGDSPVCCWCFDYHAMLVNSAALALLGLGPHTPDPEGGSLGREGDALTGALYEQAALDAWHAMTDGPLDPDELRAGLDVLGAFAEIHDLKSSPDLGPALRALRDEGVARETRILLHPLMEDLDALASTRNQWEDDALRLAGGKIFVDGTLNSRTAWMLTPYADAEQAGRPGAPNGMALMTVEQIAGAITKCAQMGIGLAAHAIGDGAVRAVLDAVARARPPRWSVRIEHAEVIDECDIPRFAELGVIASLQPCHLLADVEVLRRALPHRLDRVLPVRDLLDAGLQPGREIMFGSDAPIVRPDPEDSIIASVTRRRPAAPPSEAIAPQQAIDEAQAWACFEAGDPLPEAAPR